MTGSGHPAGLPLIVPLQLSSSPIEMFQQFSCPIQYICSTHSNNSEYGSGDTQLRINHVFIAKVILSQLPGCNCSETQRTIKCWYGLYEIYSIAESYTQKLH